jgi:hypothetical protein
MFYPSVHLVFAGILEVWVAVPKKERNEENAMGNLVSNWGI